MKSLYNLYSPVRTVAALLLSGIFLTGMIACSDITDYGEEEISRAPSGIQDVSKEDLKGELDFKALPNFRAKGAITLNAPLRPKMSTSISLDNRPMYIVDGLVISSTGLSDLEPSSIESIEVLKGAAAKAIHGEQARHGLVKITTKDE